MKNSIYITPSSEYLEEILKTDPDFHERLKQKSLAEVKKGAEKYIQARLDRDAQSSYGHLYSKVEKKFFQSSGWSSQKTFTPETDARLSKEIEKNIESKINESLQDFVNSIDFHTYIKDKVKVSLTSAVLKELEIKILEEAKKLAS